MILVLDNRDSFVHNLARYVRELGEEAVVRRSDELTLAEVAALGPSHIVISPGPCAPPAAGISTDVIRRFGASVPILGVCLGHQCIGAAYGGHIVRAARPVHGKATRIRHDGTALFSGIPSPCLVARYHSLVIDPATMPAVLRVLATAEDDGTVMAVAHRAYPVIGVQFHPESAATEYGYAMLDWFLHGDRQTRAALPTRADQSNDTPRRASQRREARVREPFVPPPVELVR